MIDYFTPEPIVLAHRGDSARYPENTMPAFKSAVDMKVHVIETDVHLTADGEVVIWHDDTLMRMSGDPRRISQLTWEEIRGIDAGSQFSLDGGKSFPFRGKNISPVRIRDVLSEFPGTKFNIDLKDNKLELAERFGHILMELNCRERVVTASFHKEVLYHFRKVLPEALTSCSPIEILRLLLLYRSGILTLPLTYKKKILQVPEYSGKLKVITAGFVKYLHRRGFKIQVWTVNDVSEMNRFLDMGIDGLFTDRPALLIDLLKKREK